MSKQKTDHVFNFTPLVIQHFIDLIVKLATMVITAPATFVVASLIYDTRLSGIVLIVVKVAAVLLVDGVFLSSIWIIENRKNLPDSEKFTNAVIVWVLYVMLLFIAIENGEGILGWIFRAAIAIYLTRLTQATLAASLRRTEKQHSAEGIQVKWLAWILSTLLVVRQMFAEFKVKFRISGTRQVANLEAIKDNAESFQMLAQDHIFMSLFEDDANKPLLALSGPGTINSGQHFYNLKKTEDGRYVGECPVCGDKRHGETPYSVILLINGHLKEHTAQPVPGDTPLPEAAPVEFS